MIHALEYLSGIKKVQPGIRDMIAMKTRQCLILPTAEQLTLYSNVQKMDQKHSNLYVKIQLIPIHCVWHINALVGMVVEVNKDNTRYILEFHCFLRYAFHNNAGCNDNFTTSLWWMSICTSWKRSHRFKFYWSNRWKSGIFWWDHASSIELQYVNSIFSSSSC